MRIVAFLQNQWFKDPERHKRFAERYPELREDLIRRFLFAGCKTGRMLKAALGRELCDKITWEETSREIGDHSSSIFPPDLSHINTVCIKHNPDIIIAFGKQASEALKSRNGLEYLFCGPHPANRRDTTWRELVKVGEDVESLICRHELGYRDADALAKERTE